MLPEQRIAAALGRVRRRLLARHVLVGAAAGAGVALGVALALAFAGGQRSMALAASVVIVTAAGFVWSRRNARTDAAVARRIERSFPELRNLLVTAQELLDHPDRASAWMRAHVLANATTRVAALDLAGTTRLGRASIAAAVAVAALAATLAGGDRQARQLAQRLADRVAQVTGQPVTLRLVIDVEPPAYAGGKPVQLVNPQRVEALAGSLLRLRATGPRLDVVRFGTRRLDVRAGVVELRLTDSGYLAIESTAANDAPTLVPVIVRPDAAPVVKIEAPARDLLLANASAALEVTASAADDLGLDRFELRYTKVSGSGEQFEFEEGTLPLDISRESGRSWRGRAKVALSGLTLEAGDALVYRAVARDRRPGAIASSSDTFYVEIQGPGQVPLDSVDLPPDQERYALSQQMVVLKIERLRAREPALTREQLAEESANIAAEQRAVRGNFIFLMGGHVEDEEEEAAQSHEIQEGRLENSARREITSAIHHMTRSEQGLTAVNTGAALPPARAAVEALQRAFGHNRYILRMMPVRSRIDPSRRLTGELRDARDWRREVADATVERDVRDARALLADLIALAPAIRKGELRASQVAVLAERALAIDPASSAWQEVAALLRSGRLAAALPTVASLAARGALAASPGTTAPTRLESAWSEVRR